MKKISVFTIATVASFVVMPNALAVQSLSVTCGSTGQVCTNTTAFTVDAPGGVPISVQLKAPASHCSAVRYTVIPAFGSKVSTNFLNAGQNQTVQLGNLANGTHAFLITATGKLGGCNNGRVGSWSVEVSP